MNTTANNKKKKKLITVSSVVIAISLLIIILIAVIKPFSDESKYIVNSWETDTEEYVTFDKDGEVDSENTDGTDIKYGTYEIERYGKTDQYFLVVNMEDEPEATFNVKFSDDHKTMYLTTEDKQVITFER